jgi:hypothetical protein
MGSGRSSSEVGVVRQVASQQEEVGGIHPPLMMAGPRCARNGCFMPQGVMVWVAAAAAFTPPLKVRLSPNVLWRREEGGACALRGVCRLGRGSHHVGMFDRIKAKCCAPADLNSRQRSSTGPGGGQGDVPSATGHNSMRRGISLGSASGAVSGDGRSGVEEEGRHPLHEGGWRSFARWVDWVV